MSYLSIEFSVVFPIFFLLYWILIKKPALQNVLLLIASYAIVATFDIKFLAILVTYSVVLYVLSFPIYHSKKRSGLWLALAISVAIINLCFFKYFDFFRVQVQSMINTLGIDYAIPGVEILLPIGISFYTFHSISYLVSLRKKEISVPSPLDFALFLSFFPSLIAGPINRAKDFLPQIQVKQPREVGSYNKAFVLVLLALIKVLCLNTVLADNFVDPVFANPSSYNSLDILLGVYGYALQIFFNFSGYTDLVTAIALLLGFHLPKNFNMPYFANNLRDFWQRWHMSLSSWIRDYIYIPLGGSRKGFGHTQVNLFIAMTLSGLWHGASFAFIIWGIIHAIGVVLLNIGDRYLGRNYLTNFSPWLARFITFQYVCVAWVFFRSATLSDALELFNAFVYNFTSVALSFNIFLYFPLLLLAFFAYPFLAKLPPLLIQLLDRVYWVYLPIIWVIILLLVLTTAPAGIPNFIYASF
ncbi:MBOAT family protein [Gammaproteobacteria bacterium ESL0073]|nr:MBOAT family protein [Gammaproteobacteria bacterium ESL0073]